MQKIFHRGGCNAGKARQAAGLRQVAGLLRRQGGKLCVCGRSLAGCGRLRKIIAPVTDRCLLPSTDKKGHGAGMPLYAAAMREKLGQQGAHAPSHALILGTHTDLPACFLIWLGLAAIAEDSGKPCSRSGSPGGKRRRP